MTEVFQYRFLILFKALISTQTATMIIEAKLYANAKVTCVQATALFIHQIDL